MKKIISCILSVAFMFSMGITAVATEDFSQWGYEWEWTAEQDAKSSQWTDQEWNDYYDAQAAKEMMAEKKEKGLPYLEGINIKVDGKYITFPDALPTEKNDRVMVPALAVFEALGATVAYDGPSDSLTIVKGTTTIQFKIGDTKLSITENGVAREVTMDVPAYVDDKTDRTYVPTRAVAEGLGCDISWDGIYQIVYIVDKKAIIEKIDKKFTIYNSLMKNNMTDLSKTYKNILETNISGTLYGDTVDDVVSINGKFDVLSQGLNFNMSGALKLDVNAIKDSLLSTLDEENLAMLKKYENISFEMINNADEDKFYVKADGMDLIAGTPKDTWMEGESLIKTPGDMGKNMNQLTVGTLVYDLCWQQEELYGYSFAVRDVYDEINNMSAIYNIFLGDDAFQTSTSGSVTTYTIKMNKLALFARIAKYAGAESSDMLALLEDSKQISDFNYAMTIKMQNNKFLDLNMSGDMTIGGIVPTKISFTMGGDMKQATGEIKVTGRYLGKIGVSMKTTQTQSNEKLMTKPKDGAKIMLWSEFADIQIKNLLEEQAKWQAEYAEPDKA